MTGSIAAEIINLLAQKRDLPPESIRQSDRLLQDLGIDGDDAVNLFVSLQEQFGTDLTRLREHWSEHFRTTRSGCWTALVPFPSFIVFVLVMVSTGSKALGVAAALAFAFLVISAWIIHRRRLRDIIMVPITVGQVVAAAEAGMWPAQTPS